MNTVWLTTKRDLQTSGSVLLFGGFDGLHAGHKALLARAKTFGLPVGITTIVGCKSGDALFTLEERRLSFQNAGIDFVCETAFAEIKNVPANEFAERLKTEYNVQAFVCGDDFRFGKGAKGTPASLQKTARVVVEALVTANGEKISSTAVKQSLTAGDMPKVTALLGERFFVFGEVQTGRQVGRGLGFPTANIAYPKDKFALKTGVYETRVEWQGKTYKGITNYGARPTFENVEVLTETYLDGFSGDLYGKRLQIRFVRFLRDIEKFTDASALQRQLQTDIRRVREND